MKRFQILLLFIGFLALSMMPAHAVDLWVKTEELDNKKSNVENTAPKAGAPIWLNKTKEVPQNAKQVFEKSKKSIDITINVPTVSVPNPVGEVDANLQLVNAEIAAAKASIQQKIQAAKKVQQIKKNYEDKLLGWRDSQIAKLMQMVKGANLLNGGFISGFFDKQMQKLDQMVITQYQNFSQKLTAQFTAGLPLSSLPSVPAMPDMAINFQSEIAGQAQQVQNLAQSIQSYQPPEIPDNITDPDDVEDYLETIKLIE